MKGPRRRICDPTDSHPNLHTDANVGVWFQDGYPLLIMSEESMSQMTGWVREMIQNGQGNIGGEWSADAPDNKAVVIERYSTQGYLASARGLT